MRGRRWRLVQKDEDLDCPPQPGVVHGSSRIIVISPGEKRVDVGPHTHVLLFKEFRNPATTFVRQRHIRRVGMDLVLPAEAELRRIAKNVDMEVAVVRNGMRGLDQPVLMLDEKSSASLRKVGQTRLAKGRLPERLQGFVQCWAIDRSRSSPTDDAILHKIVAFVPVGSAVHLSEDDACNRKPVPLAATLQACRASHCVTFSATTRCWPAKSLSNTR